MFDKILNSLIDLVLKYIQPSTMNKCAISVVIVALPLSFLLGGWLFDVVIAAVVVLGQTTEYLYAKQSEEEFAAQDGEVKQLSGESSSEI